MRPQGLEAGKAYTFKHPKVAGGGELDFTIVALDKSPRGKTLGWTVLVLAVRGENPWAHLGVTEGNSFWVDTGPLIRGARPL